MQDCYLFWCPYPIFHGKSNGGIKLGCTVTYTNRIRKNLKGMQQKNRKERTAERNEPPSTEEYWRKFYSPLSNFSFLNSKQKFENLQYEWYNLSSEDLLNYLPRFFPRSDLQVLQLGVGSSSLFEDFSRDPLFPSNVKLINIDINETVISFMNQRQKFVSDTDLKQDYVLMDARKLMFHDAEMDVVFDKGTIDALLSNGGLESGENGDVLQVLSEVYRVLKGGGTFWLMSGNESFLLNSYLYQLDWKIAVEPIQRQKKVKKSTSEFSNLQVYLYSLEKT